MKIQSVTHNNRKKAFHVKALKKLFPFPYSKVDSQPGFADPITRVFVDKELGSEGFTYVLESGKGGTVHSEQVLEYNQDPHYLRDALLYKLTIEAQKRVEVGALVEARDHPAIANLRYAVLSIARSDQLPQIGRPTLILTACAGLRYRASRSSQGRGWESRVTHSG